MSFNHYAKIKRILAENPGWYIVRINKPTTAQNFKGETRSFDHYYRAHNADGQPIKYCKFQQLDLFAKTMGLSPDDFTIIDE